MAPSRTGTGLNPRAATPENPSFDLNSPDAWDALGATRVNTGVPISADSALTWSCWWRGVTLLANYIAKTPLHVWEKVDRPTGEGREMAKDHPAYKLLRWQANELQTAFQLQLALAGHAVNRGNGYAYIWRAGPVPIELTILDPDVTSPVLVDGRLWYITKLNGDDHRLPADDVLHIRGFGFSGLQGYPLWKMAKESIGLGLAQETFKAVRYRNQARPSVVLESPNKILPTARQELRQDWERMHVGLQNSHRTAILDNGLKVSKLSFTAEEMQEVEQAGLLIRDAANFLGIPSSKLGDVAGIKYASKEQDDDEFLETGLDFWFCSIEDEARAKLFSEEEKASDDYYVEFDRKTIARGDRTARSNYFRASLGGRGWQTPNEVRMEEGLPPLDDPDADKLMTPLNMGQGGPDNKPAKPAAPPKPPAIPSEDRNASRSTPTDTGALRAAAATALTDVTRRMVVRIGHQAERAAKTTGKYMTWLTTFEEDNCEVVQDAFHSPRQLLLAFKGESSDATGYEVTAAFWSVVRTFYNGAADRATPKTLGEVVQTTTETLLVDAPLSIVAAYLRENS